MEVARVLFSVAVLAAVCLGNSLVAFKDPPRCGNWIAYKDEKCFKLVDKSGHQTQTDGEIVCESYSEELKRESFPKLITIKTKEEQDFLHELLFVNNSFVDNVWLGLKEVGNSGIFQWNDDSEVEFSNWADQTLTDEDHHCVQMTSGKGGYAAGQWVKVHCEKRNDIMCERTQTWTLETLQNMFLNHKRELEREISELKSKNDVAENAVPSGFIYVQLAGQKPPSSLWPKGNWTDVTSTYAGLFFRAGGGNAAPFGQIQDESTKRLGQVDFVRKGGHTSPLSVPFDGSWTPTIQTGVVGSSDSCSLKFRLSADEIRPKNQAVKIWQRN